jgi:hypothetical protein
MQQEKLKIPPRSEALKLFQKYVLFSNVEEHCVTVATVAMYLAQKVKAKKIPNLNLDIVFATSLFHDLGKGIVIEKLEPVKYGFKKFTLEQMKTWKLLRQLHKPLQDIYNDLNSTHSHLDKRVHETDVVSIIAGALYPDFIHYIYQIGGTRNEVYFNASPEIKIMHYADWIVHHKSHIIPFDARLDFLFDKYWTELTTEQRADRKQKEFALEKDIFKGLDITPDTLNLKEINKLKTKLFKGQYDFFQIDKIDKIE